MECRGHSRAATWPGPQTGRIPYSPPRQSRFCSAQKQPSPMEAAVFSSELHRSSFPNRTRFAGLRFGFLFMRLWGFEPEGTWQGAGGALQPELDPARRERANPLLRQSFIALPLQTKPALLGFGLAFAQGVSGKATPLPAGRGVILSDYSPALGGATSPSGGTMHRRDKSSVSEQL